MSWAMSPRFAAAAKTIGDTVLLFHELRRRFAEMYPDAPAPACCRAPGRVNLIGEHTDYNGLPVLPMALAQEIRVAFSPRGDSRIALHNVDPSFPAVTFDNAPEILPSSAGSWENYCKAAVQGLNATLHPSRFPGMDVLVSSTLPMAAGLSSSSALVVACAMAYLRVSDSEFGGGLTRLSLAELLAEAEHYVGTRGGGMDQAVILNADAGHACKIDFFPLRVENAPLPDDCVVAVCDSTVKVKKSGEALHRYNAGPRLCALATALVQRQLQADYGEDVALERLGDLWFGPLCLTHSEAEDCCMRAVDKPRMRLAAVAARLDCTPDAVRERWIGDLPEPPDGFPIQARVRHQLTEYRRVEMARDALLAGDAESFGALMNASHESCARDFEISSPELDALVKAARDAGALGARLTGAGFGGATVNLIYREDAAAFVAAVTEQYYRQFLGYAGDAPIFIAHPSAGAEYVDSEAM